MSLWRDPDGVPHCRILSPDKTEWRLISATLCRWRLCFVADQLWFMTRIREEEDDCALPVISFQVCKYLVHVHCTCRWCNEVGIVMLLNWDCDWLTVRYEADVFTRHGRCPPRCLLGLLGWTRHTTSRRWRKVEVTLFSRTDSCNVVRM